jgi:hypothetical protein
MIGNYIKTEGDISVEFLPDHRIVSIIYPESEMILGSGVIGSFVNGDLYFLYEGNVYIISQLDLVPKIFILNRSGDEIVHIGEYLHVYDSSINATYKRSLKDNIYNTMYYMNSKPHSIQTNGEIICASVNNDIIFESDCGCYELFKPPQFVQISDGNGIAVINNGKVSIMKYFINKKLAVDIDEMDIDTVTGNVFEFKVTHRFDLTRNRPTAVHWIDSDTILTFAYKECLLININLGDRINVWKLESGGFHDGPLFNLGEGKWMSLERLKMLSEWIKYRRVALPLMRIGLLPTGLINSILMMCR